MRNRLHYAAENGGVALNVGDCGCCGSGIVKGWFLPGDSAATPVRWRVLARRRDTKCGEAVGFSQGAKCCIALAVLSANPITAGFSSDGAANR